MTGVANQPHRNEISRQRYPAVIKPRLAVPVGSGLSGNGHRPVTDRGGQHRPGPLCGTRMRSRPFAFVVCAAVVALAVATLLACVQPEEVSERPSDPPDTSSVAVSRPVSLAASRPVWFPSFHDSDFAASTFSVSAPA